MIQADVELILNFPISFELAGVSGSLVLPASLFACVHSSLLDLLVLFRLFLVDFRTIEALVFPRNCSECTGATLEFVYLPEALSIDYWAHSVPSHDACVFDQKIAQPWQRTPVLS